MKGNWKHGMADTRLYRRWHSMVGRCKYPSHTSWKWYGAIGVRVCDRWLTFENFLLDMGAPPFPDATIERKDPNGNYEPSNCCWADRSAQAQNKRGSLRLTLQGRTQTATQWSQEIGLGYDTISSRKCDGWSDERTLTAPLRQKSYTWQGKTLTRKEWAKVTGIKASTIWFRLSKGWTIAEALSTPTSGRRKLENVKFKKD